MRACVITLGLWLTALPAWAQDVSFDALFDALRLPEMIEVMSGEGIKSGIEIRDGMFTGGGGDVWPSVVRRIYEVPRMQEVVRDEMAARLDPDHIAPLVAFFTSERGQRITQFELIAREAFQIEGVEAQANAAYAEARDAGDPMLAAVQDFVVANDLVETNIVGALNSNLAFYRGLADGGALEGMDDEALLADVYGSEPEVRESTTQWVYSYLLLSYGSLDIADVAAYTELSHTPAGQGLNGALMAAFDVLFVDISRALGLGAARFMGGEDI